MSGFAIASGFGIISPQAGAFVRPEAGFMECVEEAGNEGFVPRSLLARVAKDSRVVVRERIAEAAAKLALRSVDEAEHLIQKLCADVSPRVRRAAARSLRAVLAEAPPLWRLEIVSRWALSPRASERAAIARALRSHTAVFVSDLALEELSGDRDPHVRALAARAMAHRFHEAPKAYRRILGRLCADPDPRVARTARRLLVPLARLRR
jgi:hypothetical protein